MQNVAHSLYLWSTSFLLQCGAQFIKERLMCHKVIQFYYKTTNLLQNHESITKPRIYYKTSNLLQNHESITKPRIYYKWEHMFLNDA